jgi:hypothetical protein
MDINRNYLPFEVNISKCNRLVAERTRFSWFPDSLQNLDFSFYLKCTVTSFFCYREAENSHGLVSYDVLFSECNCSRILTSLIDLFSSRYVKMWGGM